MTNNFHAIYTHIQELEAIMAAVGNKLTKQKAKLAMDYASTFLSDNVAEWVRTAEKRETEK